MVERLQAVAIQRADGAVLAFSHWSRGGHKALRDQHGYEPGDVEGFITDGGRFVTRREAVQVGVESGQLSPAWLKVGRPLLSSDINWEGHKDLVSLFRSQEKRSARRLKHQVAANCRMLKSARGRP